MSSQNEKQTQLRTFDPPEIIVVPPYQLNCNDEWPPFLETTWINYCGIGGVLNSDGGVDDGESEDGCIQYRIYTFTVTDPCGHSDTETTRLSREYDMTNPEIMDLEDYQLACNKEWPSYLSTTWTDNCAEGGEINSDAGIADGEVDCIQYRLYTFTVTDNCGNTGTETTRLSREYDMIPPEIVDVEDYQLATCNEDWPEFLTTTWTDNCSASGEINSDDGLPDGEVDCIQYRLYTFMVTDNCGNIDTETTRLSREYDMTNPEIEDLEDYQLATCNEDWPDYLISSWTDNCAEGGEINSDAGITDGEVDCIQYRLYTFTVTDNCGNTDTETTRLSREYDMIPPEIVDLADYPLACNEEWPEYLTTPWTDNCDTGGEINSDAGVDDGEVDCVQYRLYTFTVIDACGNTVTETTRVSRGNDMIPPEIVDVADYPLACNEEWPEYLTTTWTDNCATGGEINSDAGVDDGEIEVDGCVTQYRLYTFTVADSCNNTTIETSIVSREYDITPPIINEPIYELDCNEAWPEYLSTTWTDNCAEGGEIISDGGVEDGVEGDFEYRLYTFIATDDCNNTATETVRVERAIAGSSIELKDDVSLYLKCILEKDLTFNLSSLFVDESIDNGEWSMTFNGTPTPIIGGFFNPSSLLGEDGEYDENQLGEYLFTYIIEGECPTELIITIHDDCIELPCEQGVPGTALTPNGDGDNDTFFGGLDQFARAAGCTMYVQIFNRWGVKIFEDKDYKNDWSGSVQSNAFGSKGTITTGTYFYIITYDDGLSTDTVKGYFYVATE